MLVLKKIYIYIYFLCVNSRKCWVIIGWLQSLSSSDDSAFCKLFRHNVRPHDSAFSKLFCHNVNLQFSSLLSNYVLVIWLFDHFSRHWCLCNLSYNIWNTYSKYSVDLVFPHWKVMETYFTMTKSMVACYR